MKVWAAVAGARKQDTFGTRVLAYPLSILAQTYEEALGRALIDIRESHPESEGYGDFFVEAVEIPIDRLRKMLQEEITSCNGNHRET